MEFVERVVFDGLSAILGEVSVISVNSLLDKTRLFMGSLCPMSKDSSPPLVYFIA